MFAKLLRKKFLFIISIFLVLIFFSHYTWIKYDQYAYTTKRDYHLIISGSKSHILNIKDGKFNVPGSLINQNASFFLKLKCESTFWGKFKEPSISVETNDYSDQNIYELGFKGIRYLNISEAVKRNKNEISLIGNYCRIPDQKAELIISESDIDKKSPLLVIAPHPDDAEIAAFGIYSQHPKSFILTITMGEAGYFKYDEIYTDSINHYYKFGELRAWNSNTVPMLGNVPIERTLNLGYFNNSLGEVWKNKNDIISSEYIKTDDISTFHHFNKSTLKDSIIIKSNWNSLVDNIRMVLRNVKPANIITPFPKLDTHTDHKVASLALFEALKKEKLKNINLLLYSNHQKYCGESFPFGPSGTIISAPPTFMEDNIKINGMLSFTLKQELQNDKYFALEAMHDLRPDTEWLSWQGNGKMFLKESIKALYGYDKNFYRRSVRSNEFFYVKKVEELDDLLININ